MKEYANMDKQDRINEIIKILGNIDNLWILWQIHRFCINILR